MPIKSARGPQTRACGDSSHDEAVIEKITGSQPEEKTIVTHGDDK